MLVLLAAALAWWLRRGAESSVLPDAGLFGQAQSWLEELDGDPLIAASWTGESRPYVHSGGQYRLLVPDREGRLARVDLYRPVAISAAEILMTGTAAGRPFFDLYLHRLGDDVPVNLTRTPEIDEGELCVRAGSPVVAYRSGERELFARVRDGALEPLAAPTVRGFDECAWLDDRRLVGIAGRQPPFSITECTVGGAVECLERTGALDAIARVNDLVAGDGVAYLSGLARGGSFRTVFEVRPHPAPLAAVSRPAREGDLLDWTPDMWRIGHRGRYVSSLAPDSPATIYEVRRIGRRVFAIAADAATPRTLAVLDGGRWKLLPPSAHRPAPLPTQEVWTVSPRGERHQSFYFGRPDARRVVVWFHGGPRESVSPRFNPYYHALSHLGFGVMAVNYPGSTGRGAAYEDRFRDDDALADALQSVWDELRRRRVTTIVSWSVSAGGRLPRVLLQRGFPLSAVVNQAGFDNEDLLSLARRAGVPLFAIRGRHDTYGPGTRIDLLYEGGHDITHPEDFTALFAALPAFLSSAPAVTWSHR